MTEAAPRQALKEQLDVLTEQMWDTMERLRSIQLGRAALMEQLKVNHD